MTASTKTKPLSTAVYLVVGALAALALMATSPGFAETSVYDGGAGLGMEEVVVTARKWEETASEVPISISVYSFEDLQAAGIRDIDELALFTPGFSFEKAFGRQLDRPVIRGMSTILSSTQVEQNAAFYIDGVFVSGAISSTSFFDLERIEVLKGPQNALFGRSAFAGAVNYITKKPGEYLAGRLTASAATDDEFRLAGNISGPLVGDRLYFFLGGNYYSYGGEYLNRVTDRKLGGEETLALSGSLRFTPTRSFEALARVVYTADNDEHHPTRLQDSSFNNCFLNTSDQYYCGEVVNFDDVELNTDSVAGGGLQRDTLRTSLAMSLDLSHVSITTITAYNDEQLDAGLDQDFTGREPIEFFPFCPGFECLKGSFQTVDLTTFEDFSQELRIASAEDAALRWQFGLNYFWRQQGGERFQPSLADKPIVTTRNYAAFGQAAFDLTDRLKATAELRIASDEKDMLLPDGARFATSFASVSPRVTLEGTVSGDDLIYVSVAQGSKPGGFNARTELPDELKEFGEENAWHYEIGYKASTLDRRATLALSAFYIDWTRQQLTSSFERPDGPSIIYTENAGKTRVLGLEIAVRYQPADGIDLGFTYALADAVFRQFDVAEQAALTGDPSVRGNQTPRAPKHMATAFGEFRRGLKGDLEAFLRLDLIYEAKRYAQVHNLAHSGDKFIFNLRLGIDLGDARVELWGKNLFGDKTAVSILRFRDFAGFDSFNAPRAFGITLPRGRQIGVSASYVF